MFSPGTDHGPNGSEGLVRRMQAKFSEHQPVQSQRKKRFTARAEKSPGPRQNSRTDFEVIMKKFDEPCLSENSSNSVNSGLSSSSSIYTVHRTDSARHGFDSFSHTVKALRESLSDREALEHAWEAIVSRKGGDFSWPSVIAIVSEPANPSRAAVFVLASCQKEASPLRIRAIVPMEEASDVYMMGSGSLGLETLSDEGRVTLRLHMTSVLSLWMAFNSLRLLLERTTPQKQVSRWTGTWLSKYADSVESMDFYEANAEDSCRSGGSFINSLDSIPDDAESRRMKADIVKSIRRAFVGCDLETITCKDVYRRVDQDFGHAVRSEYKRFIDEKMIMVMGQMEEASEVFDDFLYLGSEWNAGNMKELETNSIDCILNVTKEIPSIESDDFIQHRVPVADRESENLLEWIPDTVDFMMQAERRGSRCLVHCQRGISRSASMVVAYGMKSRGWTLEESLKHVRKRRDIVKPNPGFLAQLKQYERLLRSS
uniref:protein-serine/threonine phosphatase n=1 Tax=Rhodosorus marinus TaxID=101924 RepID=A0A7S3EC69_9RHOD|mmetsp:Transcript_22031/g.89402  ORF Transcript_22031/g.89402 Transcript_22031/m.89402 type:complete len:485 (+) Transcript_22031:120-1574(+)